MRLYRSVPRS
ncbi:unnamed protein product, partial [Allacma fusca]